MEKEVPWSQMTSWLLLIVGIATIFIGLVSPGRVRTGRVSRRRLLVTTGAMVLVASAGLFGVVTILLSSRVMPV